MPVPKKLTSPKIYQFVRQTKVKINVRIVIPNRCFVQHFRPENLFVRLSYPLICCKGIKYCAYCVVENTVIFILYMSGCFGMSAINEKQTFFYYFFNVSNEMLILKTPPKVFFQKVLLKFVFFTRKCIA